MGIVTRLFGEVDPKDKKLFFPDGIIGFPDMHNFMLISDLEKPDSSVMWLQSLDETQFALPVVDPSYVVPDYKPSISDSTVSLLGGGDADFYVLVVLRVPSDIKDMSVNLRAPIIINPDTMRGAQDVSDDNDAPVRYHVYNLLKRNASR